MNVLEEKNKNPAFHKAMVPASMENDPHWLQGVRTQALSKFKALGLPDRGWEAWKYVPLKSLLEQKYEAALPSLDPARFFSALPFADEPLRCVLADGRFLKELSSVREDQKFSLRGFEEAEESEAGENASLNRFRAETNPFVFMNTYAFSKGVIINIRKDVSLERPLHLFLLSAGGAKEEVRLIQPRVLIQAEENSKASIIIHEMMLSESPSLTNSVIEIELRKNANLNVVSVQKAAPKANLFSSTRVYLADGSRFESVILSRGGDIIRNDVVVNFEDVNGYAEVSGLGMLSGDSKLFNEISIQHKHPECSSRQFFKNILSGASQAEFNSLAHVHAGAQRSDSQQLNKNLLLSREARVYARPSLKIYADDVKASHGSASGYTEKQELFYLQSRGLDKQTAQFMLTYGFALEILFKIKDAPMRGAAESLVREALQQMMS